MGTALAVISILRTVSEILKSIEANQNEPTPEYLEARRQVRAQVLALLESLK